MKHLAFLLLLGLSVAACKKSSTTETTESTTTTTVSTAPETNSAAVQEYMQAYEQYLEEYKMAVKEKNSAKMKELGDRAQELTDKGKAAMAEATGEDLAKLQAYMKEKADEFVAISQGKVE